MPTKLDRSRETASARDSARSVFDHAQIGMAVLTSTGALVDTNPALQHLLGLAPKNLRGRSLMSLVDATDQSLCASTLTRLSADEAVGKIDVRLAAPNHIERWVRVRLSLVPTDDTSPSPIVGTFEEITDEKQAADRARATSLRMEQLVERANDIIFNIDLEGRFTWVNPAASRLMKRPVDELLGMSFLELVHADHRRRAGRFYMKQIRERIPSTYYEFPAVTAGGEEIWLGQFVQLILEDDQIVNVQAVARNITARKQAEDALRASEERVRAVVSNAPIILWAADTQGVFTLCEGHGLKGLGLDSEEVVGGRVAQVYTDPSVHTHLQRALKGETFRAEITLSGQVFDSWYSPLRDGDVVTGVIGVAVDVTEYVRLSERLRDAAKMEAIGRLAGGVAHDFNNQLTAILGFADIIRQSFDDDDPRTDDVLQIIRGGRRAAALTEQLLAFGREQPRRPTVLDLNTVLSGIETLLHHTVREETQLDFQLAPNLWSVSADEVQIEQVIMNLALNSRDAMPTGGRVTIRTANVTLDDPHARDHPPLSPGDYVMVAVTDTGEGIDAMTLAHVFEPFFTTKEEGKGTGMGLASAHGIISQSGGCIEVASEPGQGSTFTFYLPSSGTPAAADDDGEYGTDLAVGARQS